MPDIENRIAALRAVVVGILRLGRIRQVVRKVGDIVAPGIVQSEAQTRVEAARQRHLHRVISGIAVIGGHLQKSVIARGVVVEIRIGEDDYRSAVGAIIGHNSLIRIAKPVHFVAPVPDIRHIQRRVMGKLELRTEAGLFDVARALIGILRAKLNIRQIGAAGNELTGRKSIS